ncbi:hypothetical protein RRX38_05430 [Pseudomonas sp. DTU_2021_1001937_2_SI_NGA_ILE_001]|uniref:hypothetical protein n=1 Tax=Pseudomonas sp. DTU_2021_1001937_2_SI_NGA_ILE_001 TaxID=3077589 RepID=UPI0028FC2E54|nr:hypothetical protein [Pseudomonas sp. DTU_2021_1001937_2_SI_NGA_ILE_001]WNW10619.1 hypothetical protein RRX38_05430 [Pseudomonas sp. DTU_2021_1001937_2_SI_NGA_ILE_001]
MLSFLYWLTKKGPTVLALGCGVGIFLPTAATYMRPMMPMMVFIFVLGTLLRVDNKKIIEAAKNIHTSIVFPLIFVVACPYILGWTIKLLSRNDELALAVALAVAAPPASGNSAVARMLKLAPSVALVSTLCSMVLIPVSAPLILYFFKNHVDIAINPIDLAIRLAILIGSAEGAALLIRRFAFNFVSQHGIAIDGVVISALFIFAVGTMAGMQELILHDPGLVLAVILLVYGINLVMQLSCGFLFPGWPQLKATIGLTAGNRNVGLLWSALGLSISPTLLLVFACSQLPIHTMPRILQYVLPRLKIT